jgi:hypothetical protein
MIRHGPFSTAMLNHQTVHSEASCVLWYQSCFILIPCFWFSIPNMCFIIVINLYQLFHPVFAILLIFSPIFLGETIYVHERQQQT